MPHPIQPALRVGSQADDDLLIFGQDEVFARSEVELAQIEHRTRTRSQSGSGWVDKHRDDGVATLDSSQPAP